MAKQPNNSLFGKGLLLKAWMYSLGSYSDDKTEPYDKVILVERTLGVLLLVINGAFFIIANGRGWVGGKKTRPSSIICKGRKIILSPYVSFQRLS